MATVRDVCTAALRMIGVTPVGEGASAEDMAEAVAAYNGLMAGAYADGWTEAFTAPFAAQGPSDAVPLPEGFIEGLKAAVAVRVASVFSVQISPQTRVTATLFMARLADADRAENGQSRFPVGVWNPRPGRWQYGL